MYDFWWSKYTSLRVGEYKFLLPGLSDLQSVVITLLRGKDREI